MIVRTIGAGPVRLLALLVTLLTCGLPIPARTAVAQATGWLDGDPGAIWARPPGFYQEGADWYAILHVKPDVVRVRLADLGTDRYEVPPRTDRASCRPRRCACGPAVAREA